MTDPSVCTEIDAVASGTAPRRIAPTSCECEHADYARTQSGHITCRLSTSGHVLADMASSGENLAPTHESATSIEEGVAAWVPVSLVS
jgi:hypothetical protein